VALRARFAAIREVRPDGLAPFWRGHSSDNISHGIPDLSTTKTPVRAAR
jgi:hypothetical protein